MRDRQGQSQYTGSWADYSEIGHCLVLRVLVSGAWLSLEEGCATGYVRCTKLIHHMRVDRSLIWGIIGFPGDEAVKANDSWLNDAL